ncbi:hypothetical protein [Parasediminibacterium sp. JCM 36343]|uniref:hypothetical protein n=1 Tax=Parasediminibacterium sp. JCM 36343 TaxID=3374279 RepID=UPI00397C62BA
MKLKDLELTDNNHFVAMEYYYLILNRTFLVLKTKGYLIGIQGNGLISVEGGKDILTRQITSNMAIKGDLTNPYSYLKNKFLEKIVDLDLLDGSILNANKINFIIKTSDIKSAVYNSSKKFGMGPYPHDGRVTIETYDNKKREFIILGNQSGENIANFITIK